MRGMVLRALEKEFKLFFSLAIRWDPRTGECTSVTEPRNDFTQEYDKRDAVQQR